jgi:phage tail sheath protein FI
LFRPTVLANLANSGITVLQPTVGGGLVIWGKTTTTSGFVEEQEISIVFIRDRVAKSLRAAFKDFIGVVDSATLQGSLMARANSALQGFVASGLITAFDSLIVARDSVDPTQWNISVLVQPAYPVNFILIEASIGLIAS